MATKAEKERQERIDQIARLMVENEREEQQRILQHFRSLTALISISISLGQAIQQLLGDACQSHEFVQTRMSKRIRQTGKESVKVLLNNLKVAEKNLRGAKNSLYTFQDIQEEFTASGNITIEQQVILGEAQLKHYHELAELCCLYFNAEISNPRIMDILRPILIEQTKADDIAIPYKTIEFLKLKTQAYD